MDTSIEPRPDWPYYVLREFFRTTYSLFLGLTVRGTENVPRSGPAVVLANHESLLDPYLITFVSSRPLAYMGKEELFRGFGGWLFPRMNCGKVRRGAADVGAFRFAARVLAQGRLFVMFPEGTRSVDGRLQQAQPGAISIALRSGAPILPVGIVGTREALGVGHGLRRHPVALRVGQPLEFAGLEPKAYRDKTVIAQVGERVMSQIAVLRRELRRELGLPPGVE